jgi:hypothetical protein
MDALRAAGTPGIPAFHKAVIFLAAAYVFLAGVTRPFHNWDMIAYVAAAHFDDGLRGEALRDRTYGDVRNEVGADTFERLVGRPGDRDYRRTVFEDPRALEQQVPLYSIKVTYVGLIRAAGRLGLSYPKATYWISALFSGLSVVILGALAHRVRLHALVVPLVALVAGYVPMARLSVPDAPACFFSLLAVLLALRRSGWLYAVSAILPLLRTEYLILSGLLMAHECLGSGRRRNALLSLAFSVGGYLAVNALRANYGWVTLFNFTMITGPTPFPAEMSVSTSLADYLAPYPSLALALLNSYQLLTYCLAAYAIVTGFGRHRGSREFRLLLVIPLVFLAARLALFPHYEERYLCFPISAMLIGIFGLLGRTSLAGNGGRES